jgi:hypothetical protein
MVIASLNMPMSFSGGNRERVKSQMSFADWTLPLLVVCQSKTVKMISPRVGAGWAGFS